MRNRFRFAIVVMGLLCAAGYGFDQNHAKWTQVLANYQVEDGRMVYAKLKRDLAADKDHPLTKYLGEVASQSRTQFDYMSRAEQMAFLINAYNALTVKLVADHYPTKGIKELGTLLKSVWKREFFALLEGQVKNLETIEHDILRPKYADYRVHAAISYASVSSPRLAHVAFTGAQLEGQLDEAFRNFLSDSARNRYEPESKTFFLSKVFDWFRRDFEKDGGPVKVVAKYGPAVAKEMAGKGGLVAKTMDFNWSLNDAPEGAMAVKH
jgi:hypothetical protein